MPESHRLQSVQAPIIPVIADLIQAHPGTISLGQGVVNYGPPSTAIAEITRFLAEPANHKYQGVSGIPILRERITQKLTAENCICVGETIASPPARRRSGNRLRRKAKIRKRQMKETPPPKYKSLPKHENERRGFTALFS